MRFRDLRLACFAIWLTGVALSAPSAAADAVDASGTTTERASLNEQDVERAIEQLKADPNLATERKTRTLRWREKNDDKREEKARPLPRWMRWIGDFFSWLGETARVLVWLAAGLLVAILVVWIVRYLRESERRTLLAMGPVAPTHVRDLDIRPESLPANIGRAALELWESGSHRAALSLLYRGLLSRLAHTHAVPIKHSSTEGECRLLALQHLPMQSHEYVTLLIHTWQRAVYGGTDPQTETMQHLCAKFSSTLDPVSAPATSSPSIASSPA